LDWEPESADVATENGLAPMGGGYALSATIQKGVVH
jgi:hypothetical protein